MEFTKKQISDIFLKYAYILVDTREKRNEHIVKYLNDNEVKWINQSLKYGDYGIMIKANEEYGFEQDLILPASVERKNSLDEIGANLTKYKERFANEMERCVSDNGLMIILIENASYGDIEKHNYKNQIHPNSFKALLHTLYPRYGVMFEMISKEDSPKFIYNYLKYFARSYLQGQSVFVKKYNSKVK